MLAILFGCTQGFIDLCDIDINVLKTVMDGYYCT